MPKRVFLLRHGKSDWKVEYEGDHERPLAPRGQKAARLMGRFLRDSSQIPDLVITSSAVRAESTAHIASREGKWGCRIVKDPTLYGADPPAICELVQSLPDSLESVLLVGHEPTWSTLAGLWIGEGKLRVPTAALVRIDFMAETWRETGYGRGELVLLLPPRLLGQADRGK